MKTLKVWPRQPFVGLALAAVAGILAAEAHPNPSLGLWLLLPAILFAWLRRSSVAVYASAALAFFFLHSARQTDSPGLRFAREWGEQRQALAVSGFVVNEPTISARGTASFYLRLKWYERDGERRPADATILARWRGDARYGDEVQLFGVAQPVSGPRNPGEFDMRAFLARRDVRHALIVRSSENGRILNRGGGNPILRAAHASRAWLQAALRRGLEDSPEQHSLISGIVLGLRDATPDEVVEEFQQTGTIHLFAVAGLHVGIVAYLLWTVANAVRLPRKVAICLIVPALFFYAAITGLNTASVRAATMAGVVLGGAFLDRRVLAGNSLAAAAFLLLCVDTEQLFSMGFQLSFAVVGTIILTADRVFKALVRWIQPDPFLPPNLIGPVTRLGLRAWRLIARGASVSLAAWIGSLLLILPYFYIITPVSIFANLAVVPIAFFILAVGLMSLVTSVVAPWLALVFNHANWSLASATLVIVNFFAHLPAGHVYLEIPSWPSGARLEMTALDVGAGAALHVRGRRTDWMFDTGAERDFRRVVRGYLQSRGVNRLDGLVLSHGDAAHIGAAESVLRTFRPRQFVDTAVPDRSRIHRDLIAYLEAHQIAREFWAKGDEAKLDPEITARILFPPDGFSARTADDQALVVQLQIAKRWRVLLTCDSGEATERALLVSNEDLRSDILIKGQHHSGASGSAEFLERVQPCLIIASSAEFPENERVKEDWAQDVVQRGIKLFRQDQTGAVALRFYRDRWEAVPYLGGESVSSQ